MLLRKTYTKLPKIHVPNYADRYEDRYEDLRGVAEANELRYLGTEKTYNPNDTQDVPMEWEAYYNKLNLYAAKRVR